ncbi:MAG: PorV/PorQ family protein [Salibacteraceae bacterium]
MIVKLKHIVLLFLIGFGLNLQAQILPNLGGQRTGSSTLVFLKNDASSRSAGMGGANITLSEDGFSSFTNPASITTFDNINISSSNFFIGDGINQSFISVITPWNEKNTSFMFTVNNLASGKQEVRTEFQPEGTGEYFYVTNTALGLGVAKNLSDQFSFGLKIKYIYESMAQYKSHSVAADLGFLYKTDIRDLSFAVSVNNFGGSSKLNGDFQAVSFGSSNTNTPDKYPLPTTFKIGISALAIDKDDHKLLAAAQLNHPNDNSENLRFGLEYGYKKLVFVRAGYVFGRKSYKFPTFGAGYRTRIGHKPLEVNYAMIPSQFLGVQHTIGLSLTFHKAEERK